MWAHDGPSTITERATDLAAILRSAPCTKCGIARENGAKKICCGRIFGFGALRAAERFGAIRSLRVICRLDIQGGPVNRVSSGIGVPHSGQRSLLARIRVESRPIIRAFVGFYWTDLEPSMLRQVLCALNGNTDRGSTA